MSTPAISVQHISYHYPDKTPALKHISFEIQPGERVALIGPNGAGKSTLLCHLNGILFPDTSSGQIEIFGVPVDKKTLADIRHRVGVVFQDPDDQLFCPTVFDDVAFGPLNMGCSPDEVRTRVARALEQVDLHGYENRSAFHLSGGEKKRVSLATVLSMEADILAFDEPSSNLDPKSRRDLIRWLNQTQKTLLIATHDLDFAYETTGRVIVLNGGAIVGDCPVETILRDESFLMQNHLELPLKFQ
jgi:cobalt/nickel transport system ATP-binding protein